MEKRKSVTGRGIRNYSENNIEYRCIDNLNKLYNIINYIYPKKTGNSNFKNEKKND